MSAGKRNEPLGGDAGAVGVGTECADIAHSVSEALAWLQLPS